MESGTTTRCDDPSKLGSGCTLFEMLVGEPPFTGPTSQVVCSRHLAADVPSTAVALPAVPPPVDAAARRAMGKAKADRHESARAVSWLERAYEERDPLLPVDSWYPDLKLDRGDPRFQEILRRLALP